MGVTFTRSALAPGQDHYGDALTGFEAYYRGWMSGAITMSTGVLRLSYATCSVATPVTTFNAVQGSTAAGATPTLIRFGLWTADAAGALLALVASTANDTALMVGAANTLVTKAASATYTPIVGQRYAFGVLVVTAAAAPTLQGGGGGSSSAANALSPRLHGTVSGQTDLPASLAVGSITAATSAPWIG